MKYVTAMALGAAFALASCVSKGTVVRVEDQRDSLVSVVSAKDSLINAVFEDINAISENLVLIKTRENLISVAGGSEGGRRPVEEINNDIAAIDRLLQENKDKIASLQRAAAQLRKANLRIDGLEKMIADLNKQLAGKKDEIARLRESLDKMGVEVEVLTEQVAEQNARAENLSSEKVELENQLHTVYYIVGVEKELRDAQIIDKQGFIGRTLTVNNTNNLESFTKADSRLLSEIPVGRKKVTVVTAQPEDSYQLVTGGEKDKIVTKLLITDPVRFWESSKILIISINNIVAAGIRLLCCTCGVPQLSRHPVFYTSGCVADRFPSGCAGAFRGMDCFVWKGSIWPFEATVTWDWDFGPICLAGKVYALFFACWKFCSLLCRSGNLRQQGAFVCKKGGRKCLFFVGYDFFV